MKLASLLAIGALLIAPLNPPEKGDYLQVSRPGNKNRSHYIFQNTRTVYYGYDENTKKSESEFTPDEMFIENIFQFCDGIDFMDMKGLNENNCIDNDSQSFVILTRRKGDFINSVCWNENDTTEQTKILNNLLLLINSLW